MNCVFYNDYLLTIFIKYHFVSKMEILANKLLPTFIYPLLFQAGSSKN